MTNPDREELVKLADKVRDWTSENRNPLTFIAHERRLIETALRRLAEAGTQTGPVAWRYRFVTSEQRDWSDWFIVDDARSIPNRPLPDVEIQPLYTAPPADAGMREASIVTCCVTGAIPGDGGACGDCDPCLFGEASIPSPVKRLIAEKNSLLHRIGELEAKLAEALTAPGATTKSDGGFDECAASGQSCIYAGDGPNGEFQCTYCGKLEPSGHIDDVERSFDETPLADSLKPSDPSPTRSDVTVESLADWLNKRGSLIAKAALSNPGRHSTIDLARALLDQFEIRRK